MVAQAMKQVVLTEDEEDDESAEISESGSGSEGSSIESATFPSVF